MIECGVRIALEVNVRSMSCDTGTGQCRKSAHSGDVYQTREPRAPKREDGEREA